MRKKIEEEYIYNKSFIQILNDKTEDYIDPMNVLMVCAMPEELNGLVEALNYLNIPFEVTETNKLKKVVIFDVNNYHIVASNLGITYFNMFKIHDLLTYNPEYVINFGTCASLIDQPRCEIVISNNCVCNDLDLTVFGYNDGDIIKYKENTIGPLMVSGSFFLCNDDLKAKAKERFKGATTFEMETYGLKKVCQCLDLPFISMRAISDEGNEESEMKFDDNATYVSSVSAAYIIEYLRKHDIRNLK